MVTTKICKDCSKVLENGDSFYCETCFQRAQDDMEGIYSFDEERNNGDEPIDSNWRMY